jgi:hypothetical protein
MFSISCVQEAGKAGSSISDKVVAVTDDGKGAQQSQGTKRDHSSIMLFFGVFFATFQSAGIWGNLITASGETT